MNPNYTRGLMFLIDELEIDADFIVALPDNGRGDLSEEIPKGGYRVSFD